MDISRSAMLGSALLLVSASAARLDAQDLREVAVGWELVSAKAFGPAEEHYTPSVAFRGSLGQSLSSRFSVRFDADVMLFRLHARRLGAPGLCQPQGPCQALFDSQERPIVGATVDGLLNLNSSGSRYVIGGMGDYDVNASGPSFHFGMFLGGGMFLPLGSAKRFVVETSLHELTPRRGAPAWVVPVTVGVRF